MGKRKTADVIDDDDKDDGNSTKRTRTTKEATSVDEMPTFRIENGLRLVSPYFTTMATHCKRRWLGRRVDEVFAKEFTRLSEDYVHKAIKLGRMRINGKRVSADYRLRDNDLCEHRFHRHESVICATPALEIISNLDNLLIVNKPCSWPIHACGAYYYNTLISILQREYGCGKLYTCYRLDRLTSGLMIFAKDPKTLALLKKGIDDRRVDKVYVAEVDGVFPETATCTKSITPLIMSMGIQRVCTDDEEEVLKQEQKANEKLIGKTCETTFERISTNGHTSIVRCRPKTGRTHQIRVHLQYLGHPITNDRLYNCQSWGVHKGKGGDYGTIPLSELGKHVERAHSADTWITDDQSIENAQSIVLPDDVDDLDALAKADTAWDTALASYDKYCVDCHRVRRHPRVEEMIMHLHCLKYECPTDGWSHETPMPEWAKNNENNEREKESVCDTKLVDVVA